MPRIEVDVTRIRTTTEYLTLEIDVPQNVIDDDVEELFEWVEENTDWHTIPENSSIEDLELDCVEVPE